MLDPFAGSGTTLLCADRMGRDAIGIDLKSEYVAMSEKRVRADAPLLTSVSVERSGGQLPLFAAPFGDAPTGEGA